MTTLSTKEYGHCLLVLLSADGALFLHRVLQVVSIITPNTIDRVLTSDYHCGARLIETCHA